MGAHFNNVCDPSSQSFIEGSLFFVGLFILDDWLKCTVSQWCHSKITSCLQVRGHFQFIEVHSHCCIKFFNKYRVSGQCHLVSSILIVLEVSACWHPCRKGILNVDENSKVKVLVLLANLFLPSVHTRGQENHHQLFQVAGEVWFSLAALSTIIGLKRCFFAVMP